MRNYQSDKKVTTNIGEDCLTLSRNIDGPTKLIKIASFHYKRDPEFISLKLISFTLRNLFG